MRMLTRFALALAAITLVLSGSAVAAQAAISPQFASNCPSGDPNGSFCLYSDFDGLGIRAKYGSGNSGCVNIAGAFNDLASSAVNVLAPTSWKRAVIIYRDANCQGSSYVVLPYGQSVDFGFSFNNTASSLGFLSGPFGG